ncbi:metal-dependent transcriptional regulator [Lachnoclostridium sp. Marseille-P6806]|uniref:metal-dependent transcriptional regulator n=1 Tax=Lachnoclostridium sp. Marseille-P6806 TaxID=2364793 RepID=UPI0013EF129E|nr:metal-dependent transcriptional regulator [Lachnoclostridium sp. Marseille-P6806]
MDEKHLGKSKEDYLEAILMLNKKKGWCREIDVAVHLSFSKPSVSIALSKLESGGYITRENSGEIRLTQEGLRIAEATLEKHEFFKSVFMRLGVAEAAAETDACLVEHSISEDTFEKIRRYVEEAEKRRSSDGSPRSDSDADPVSSG